MSIFSEKDTVLCGYTEVTQDAVCCGREGHEGSHTMVAYVDVARRLNATFTPSAWAAGPFKTDDRARMF